MVGWEDEFFISAGVWSWAGPVIQKQHKTRSPALLDLKSAAVIFNLKKKKITTLGSKSVLNCIKTTKKMDLHQR